MTNGYRGHKYMTQLQNDGDTSFQEFIHTCDKK